MSPYKDRKKKRVTISDVALEAGVSIAAVSRILNNSYEGFSAREETKQRVYDAVKKLGYRPSRAAITLATGKRNAIALCYPGRFSVSKPISAGSLDHVFRYFELILAVNGLTRAIGQKHEDLILIPIHGDRPPTEFGLQLQDKVDGVLWLYPENEKGLLRELIEAGLPIAVIGPSPIAEGLIHFQVDEERAGRIAMGEVLLQGARDILMVIPKDREEELSIQERLAGISAAAEEFPSKDVQLRTLVWPGKDKKGLKSFGQHLEKKGRPDAILALDATLPFPILHELYQRELEVPSDVLLIGFEETPLFAVNFPSVTGIRYPIEQMCHDAAELLLKPKKLDDTGVSKLIAPQLILRDSCP